MKASEFWAWVLMAATAMVIAIAFVIYSYPLGILITLIVFSLAVIIAFLGLDGEVRKMTNGNDFERGRLSAWRRIYLEAITQMGDNDSDGIAAALITERNQAIQALMILCDEFGDLDWDDSYNLSEIISNHLGDHLYNTKSRGIIYE